MKKKLLVTDFFRPEPGGLESYYTGIARNWNQKGLEVLVTAPRFQYIGLPGDRKGFDTKEPYSIVRLQPRERRILFWLKNKDLKQYLHARLLTGRYDHILIGNLSPGPLLASSIARELGIPYSVFITGSDFRNRMAYWQRGNRKVLDGASRLFAFSRKITETLQEKILAGKPIITLSPAFEPGWSDRDGNLPYGLAQKVQGKGVILGLGPLVPRKGLDRLIRAFDLLADMRPHLHLVIVGSGPEYSYLEALTKALNLQDQVSFTGYIPDDQIHGLLQMAHLVVQPGQERDDDEEAMSVSLLEAAWAGVPVIAGKLGGMIDLVEDGVTGRFVSPGNIDETCRMIRYFFLHEQERARMGKEARLRARREFRMDLAASLIESHLP